MKLFKNTLLKVMLIFIPLNISSSINQNKIRVQSQNFLEKTKVLDNKTRYNIVQNNKQFFKISKDSLKSEIVNELKKNKIINDNPNKHLFIFVKIENDKLGNIISVDTMTFSNKKNGSVKKYSQKELEIAFICVKVLRNISSINPIYIINKKGEIIDYSSKLIFVFTMYDENSIGIHTNSDVDFNDKWIGSSGYVVPTQIGIP